VYVFLKGEGWVRLKKFSPSKRGGLIKRGFMGILTAGTSLNIKKIYPLKMTSNIIFLS